MIINNHKYTHTLHGSLEVVLSAFAFSSFRSEVGRARKNIIAVDGEPHEAERAKRPDGDFFSTDFL